MYRSLIEHLPDAVFVVQDDRIVFANPAAARLAGAHHADELLGRAADELLSPDEQQFVERRRRPAPDRLRSDPQVSCSLLRRDGRFVEVESTFLPFDHAGRRALLAVVHDLTVRRNIERVAQRFRIALESSPDAFFLIDPASMRFLDVNATACDSLGYTRAELLELGPHDVKPLYDKDSLREHFSGVLAGTPGAGTIRTLHRRKDGSSFPVEVSLRPFESDACRLIVVVARDISERQLAERQLNEANERLLQLAENVSEVFWVHDFEEDRLVYVSPAFGTLFPKPARGAARHPRDLLDNVHPADLGEVAAAFERQQLHQQGLDLEYRAVADNGEIRWIRARTFPIRNVRGKVYRMAGVAEDVTRRRESEEQYRTVIQASIDGFWVVDPQGRLLDCNDAYCRALGHARQEVIGLSIFTLCHNESVEHIRAIMERGHGRFEIRHRHKDGQLIDMEVSACYQPDSGGGRIFAFLRDVSQRKWAEDALRDSESRYRGLVANLPGIAYRCALDADWTVQILSGEVERLTGFPPGDFLDKRRAYASLIHPDDAARVARLVREAVAERRSFEFEYRLCHAAGHVVAVHEKGHGVYADNGDLLWLDGFIWDVTDRRRAEQALVESEERYRAVVEGQTELISRFRTDGTFIFVNDAYCRFFGKTREALIGQHTWHPMAHPEDQPGIEARLGLLSPQNPVVVIENRVYSGQWNVHWMQFVNQAFFDDDGRIVEIQSVGRDISDRKRVELALREAEAFKRAILDAVSTQVAVLDHTGTIIEMNEAWRRSALENCGVVGCHASRTGIGTNYLEVCLAAQGKDAEGAQGAARGIRAVLDGSQKVFIHEYACHTPERQRWFLMTVTPLGVQGGVVVSHSDISAPRLLAEELRESEANLARAQSIARIGSWKLDLQSSRLLWSEETHRIFGIPLGTPLTLERFLACVHPDDREAVATSWNAAIGGAPYDIEHRILVDGTLKWVHEQAEIRRDAEGRPVTGFGSVQDVTERKQAELALRQSDARSRSILRAAPVGIGVVVDRVIHEVNEAMTTITGFDQAELLGQSARMLYPTQADFDFVGTEKYRQIRGHGIGSVETRWRRKDGRIIDILLSSSPIVPDDLSQGVTFTAQDITATKRAEQERLAHEARQRDALVQEVHHRIKNNLQGVIGLLRQHIADHPDTRLPIQAAIAQVNTVAVVHGLQSRMPQNELRMRELLREVSRAAAALAMVPCGPAIDDALSGDVLLDRNAVVTVALILNELIQNALKHGCHADGPEVSIALAGDSRRVTIRIGNPGALRPENFDLDSGHGCGTGLNLVRTLLPRHGARLSLRDDGGYVLAEFILSAPVTAHLEVCIN